MESIVEQIVIAAVGTGVGLASKLAGLATQLLLFIIAWQWCMSGLRLAVGAQDWGTFWGDMFETLMYGGIAYLIINGLYAELVRDGLWATKDQLIGALGYSGNGFITHGPATGTGGVAQVTSVLDMIVWTTYRDAWAEAGRVASEGSLATRITLALHAIPMLLLSTAMLAAMVIVAQVVKVIVCSAYVSGALMFGVGAALGPLFVATLPSRGLADYFWAWLRFMIQAMLTLVVAAIMIYLLAEGTRGLRITLQSGLTASALIPVPGGSNIDLSSYGSAFVPMLMIGSALALLLLYGYAISQVSDIVQALMSGQAGSIRNASAALGRITSAAIRQTVRQVMNNNSASALRPARRPPPAVSPRRGPPDTR
jgi:TrbL/VirB6 plasmid conjugal transfer protein